MSVYAPHRQDFKSTLLGQAGLAEEVVADFGKRVHMVKLGVGKHGRHRLVMHDGGWIEIDPESRKVITWGPRGWADDLATRLVEVEDYAVQRLEKSGGTRNPTAPRHRPRPLDDYEVKSLADRWRQLGHEDVIEDEFGCWVTLADGTRLYDVGDHVTIHGPITDAAISALVSKAEVEWRRGLQLTGTWSAAERERVWLECQRRSVDLADYQPSEALVARWEAEQSSGRASATGLRPGAGAVPLAKPMASMSAAPSTPDPNEPEPDPVDRRAQQVKEVDRQIQQLHGLWRTHANDRERIEQARREIEKLEERRRLLLGQLREHEAGDDYDSAYRGPR